jgi:hypothetical protein
MTLANEIRDLEVRSLSALEVGHNYYTYTKGVWRLMQRTVKEGRRFTIRNMTTGTSADEQTLLGLAQQYITEYHTSFTFQHFVSLFEDWLFELLRLWLLAYPRSLAGRQVDFLAVLQAPDKAAIALAVVDKELNDLKYKRVSEWFAYLEKLAHLGTPTADEIERLAEIKASRDILVHNKGVVNATYLAKAGARSRYHLGERLEIPGRYHRETWETIRRLVQDVSEAAHKKLSL